MAISLHSKSELQFVRFEGILSSEEEAALRLKLDQKINQGRKAILFDVGQLDLTDRAVIHRVQNLVSFCSNRGVFIGVYGQPKKNWQTMADGYTSPVPIYLFETEIEGTQWIEKKLTEQKPAADANTPPVDPEAEIKQKNLELLLAKYVIYQPERDYDPFMLRKLADEYKVKAQREPLYAFRRAYKQLTTVEDTLNQIEKKCHQLAQDLAHSTTIRKAPISPTEIANKKASVESARRQVEAEIAALTKETEEQLTLAAEWKAKSAHRQQEWAQEIARVQAELNQLAEENKKVLAALAASKKQ